MRMRVYRGSFGSGSHKEHAETNEGLKRGRGSAEEELAERREIRTEYPIREMSLRPHKNGPKFWWDETVWPYPVLERCSALV